MTIYNTYQEAKIANTECAVFEYQGNFGTDKEILDMFDIQSREMKECNPADCCMTVEKFLADGYKFVDGDAYLETDGDMYDVEINFVGMMNETHELDCHRYILRAAALENIPTETPEEKEVLDSIESAGEVEWKNGDLLEFNGEPCVFIGDYNGIPVVRYTENADQSLAGCLDEIYAVDKLKKPETPQQRKDRERLEVIDEMCWDVHSLKFSQASALYEAGYRKEKTNDTN